VGEVAAECYSQDLLNILWAYDKMGRLPGERVLELLEARAAAVSRGIVPPCASSRRC